MKNVYIIGGSPQEAMLDIADYIEPFYSRKRRHSTLGNISPVEYELKYQQSLIKCLNLVDHYRILKVNTTVQHLPFKLMVQTPPGAQSRHFSHPSFSF